MKISVVIPAYNEEEYIENCLLSLQNQNEKPDEIIVVDNNSTDKTIQVAQKYQVAVVKEKKQGIIYARNKAFDSARFDIIARCDADTILPKNWVKKIKENFQKNNIQGLTGSTMFYDLWPRSRFFGDVYLDFMKLMYKGGTLIGHNMAITKKIWKQIKEEVCLDESKIHEDIDLAIHLLKSRGKIKYDRSLVVKTSGRRIKHNFISFFYEYPLRLAKTFLNH